MMVESKTEILPQGVSSQRDELEVGSPCCGLKRRELIFRHLCGPRASVYITSFQQMVGLTLPDSRTTERSTLSETQTEDRQGERKKFLQELDIGGKLQTQP